MTDVTDATEVPETVTEPVRVESFSDFPIHPEIVDALAEHKITSPFPIQEMTLPVALAGHDVIGQAKTGTGKTLGFGIPLLQRVTVAPGDDGFADARRPPASRRRSSSSRPASSPCRSPATSSRPASCAACACSPSTAVARTSRRSRRCSSGVDVVVGTPGRLIDLAKQGHLDLGHVRIARPRRGRRDARPGLPARRRAASCR